MRRDLREVIADWLILLGAVALAVSLFLPWSHQHVAGGTASDPTAWQVYSIVDGCLAVLAAGLALVAMIGGRVRRLVLVIASGLALAFTIHAHTRPPTNGAVLEAHPSPGAGETVAIVGLGAAVGGLALSFATD